MRLFLVIGLLVSLFVLELFLGTGYIEPSEVIETLQEGREHPYFPIIQTRILRALGAMVAGAGLGLSGLGMQTFFRNPLAGPGVLGITSGAQLGVSCLLLVSGALGWSFHEFGIGASTTLAICGLAGAAVVLFILLLVSRMIRSDVGLLIFGLMMGYLTGALVNVLQTSASPERIKNLTMWNMGSFTDLHWDQWWLMFAVLLIVWLVLSRWHSVLDVWLLGVDYARTSGVEVRQMRIGLIVLIGVLSAVITAFCGPIAFLGLCTPHLVRGLFQKGTHKQMIPLTIITGATLAVFCDFIARLPGIDFTIPLNAVTSMIGAPLIIYILLRGRRVYS